MCGWVAGCLQPTLTDCWPDRVERGVDGSTDGKTLTWYKECIEKQGRRVTILI